MSRRCHHSAAIALACAPRFARAIGAWPTVPAAFPQQPLTLADPSSAGGPVDVLAGCWRRIIRRAPAIPRSSTTRPAAPATSASTRCAGRAGRRDAAGHPGGKPHHQPDADDGTCRSMWSGTSRRSRCWHGAERDRGVAEARRQAIPELIAKAKDARSATARPASAASLHLAMELFKDKTGADILHVPYRGSSQALSDLFGGHIDCWSTNLPVVLCGHQREGWCRWR